MGLQTLLIEDEEDLCEIIAYEINKKYPNWNLFTAGSVEEAYKLLNERRYQLVIADLYIPGSDDEPVIDVIANTSDASVIVFTGQIMTEETEAHPQVVDLLRKPFSTVDLLEIMDKHKRTLRLV